MGYLCQCLDDPGVKVTSSFSGAKRVHAIEAKDGDPRPVRLARGHRLHRRRRDHTASWVADAAVTLGVGPIELRGDGGFFDAAESRACARAVEQAVAGDHLGDISYAVQKRRSSRMTSRSSASAGRPRGSASDDARGPDQVPNFRRAQAADPSSSPACVLAIEADA